MFVGTAIWPQRFNNTMSFWVSLQESFPRTLGGPLHQAALRTLENLRAKSLYPGPCRGHMFGTIFFSELKTMHFQRCNEEQMLIPEKLRNGFWIEALHNVDANKYVSFKVSKQDAKSNQPCKALLL